MRITRVSYKNLKGRTEDVDLGAATLIHGPNFSGKTTIVDAIKLALLGHLPGLDRTGAGVMQLASGDLLSVSATIVEENKKPSGYTERVIGREWTRDAKGKVSRRDFVPMGWSEVPVVLLDAGAYFGASDRGKAELLFAAANVTTSITVPEISKALDAFGLVLHQTVGENVQQFVERGLRTAEEARSQFAASARRYADTMQGLSALATADPVPIDEDAVELRDAKAGALRDAEAAIAEAKRLQTLHERTHTPGDVKLEEARRRVRTLKEFAAQKDIEIGKCIARWDALLRHESCPMCSTPGDQWRTGAHEKKDAELKELEGERMRIKREANSVQDFVDAEGAAQAANKEKQKKSDRRKVDSAEEKAAGLREELAAAERGVSAWINDAADRKRLAEAKAKHKQHADLEKNMKEAKAYLLQLKEQMAANLFVPILDVASAFTDGILRWQLVFKDGELGMDELSTGAFIPGRTFSGTEQAIAFAGFQAALGATAPIRLVVMDELGRIDDRNKTRLLTNVCVALEKDLIDQFVGIDTEAPKGVKDGWVGPHEQRFTMIERGGRKKK